MYKVYGNAEERNGPLSRILTIYINIHYVVLGFTNYQNQRRQTYEDLEYACTASNETVAGHRAEGIVTGMLGRHICGETAPHPSALQCFPHGPTNKRGCSVWIQ